MRPAPTWPGRTSTPTSPSPPSGQMSPAIASITLTNAAVNGVVARQSRHQFRQRRRHAVRRCQRQRPGQPDPAGRLPGRAAAVGRCLHQRSHRRQLLQRPQPRSRRNHARHFNGTNFLKRVDGGAFEATDESGQALFGNGGTIVGSSLEGSNTDIADEFTKLIVTQQAYSANTKVITTSNTMVQDLLNVLR